MKLLLCPKCEDVRKLLREGARCACGKSWGRYLDDGLAAEIGGDAVPLGFANDSLMHALRHRPRGPGNGSRFVAFVIPAVCDTVHFRKGEATPNAKSSD